jgi:manganese efflux pump family protein|tara:strand:+ start:1577 stop:1882 length:306 start_codon:yes stop_codon:yes gene_type:complete
MKKLKKRWKINSNIQLLLIILVFAINGSFASWVAKPVTIYFGLEKELLSPFLYWPIRIALIFPIYQLTLPLTGFIFGQFNFFWEFEKKFLKRLGLGFLFKK